MTPQNTPIFKNVFGAQWDELPPVMRRHYGNRPFSRDLTRVHGKMNIEISCFLKIFAPLLRRLKAFPPQAGVNVPVVVDFRSDPYSNAFGLERIFYFPKTPPYLFASKMVPAGGDEIIEFMRFGIGWRARFQAQDSKIYLRHRGYCFALFGKYIPLPLEWIIGAGHAQEEALDETRFRMFMVLRHPLFGKLYGYDGEFSLERDLIVQAESSDR